MLELRALHTDIDRLCLSGFELGFCLQYIGSGHNARRVAVLRKLQRFLKIRHRFIEKFFLRIERPQLKVVLRQLRTRAQTRRFQIGGARLRAGATGFDQTANAAPHIDLPRNIYG